MTMPPNERPPNITEITLPSGATIPITAWSKLREDVVDRYGQKAVRTMWLPVFALAYMRGEVLTDIYNNIYSTYRGAEVPELLPIAIKIINGSPLTSEEKELMADKKAVVNSIVKDIKGVPSSDVEKLQAKLDPNQIQEMSILSNLQATAIERGVLAPADIEEHEGLRMVMGDMVRQWGQGLSFDPMIALANIKKYVPAFKVEMGMGDPKSIENQTRRQNLIQMARDIGSLVPETMPPGEETAVPTNKIQEILKRWGPQITPKPLVPEGQRFRPDIGEALPPVEDYQGDIERAAKGITDQPPAWFTGQTSEERAQELQLGFAQAGGGVGGAAASTGLFEMKRKANIKRATEWNKLVEKAKKAMGIRTYPLEEAVQPGRRRAIF